MFEDNFVLYDSGWSESNTSLKHRGIVDYSRSVTVKFRLSLDQEKELVKFVDTGKPGWTPLVTKKSESGLLYSFSTTFDSSD